MPTNATTTTTSGGVTLPRPPTLQPPCGVVAGDGAARRVTSETPALSPGS